MIPRYHRRTPRCSYKIIDMLRFTRSIKSVVEETNVSVIDKYHFIRQVTLAIENVRKRQQKAMPPTIRKYYK